LSFIQHRSQQFRSTIFKQGRALATLPKQNRAADPIHRAV